MSRGTLVLVVFITARLLGMTAASDDTYEELIKRMIHLEKKVDQRLSMKKLSDEPKFQRQLTRQVQILESRVAVLTLQQTRLNRENELLETRIIQLERQVMNNERTIETQRAEIERLQNDNKDIERTTDNEVWQDQPLEKQNRTRAIKKYSGGRIRRSFPEIPFAFSAVLDHDVGHAGIDQTVIFNKVLLNDGNAYNSHTGVFTVPKEGVYMFYLAFGAGYEPHKLWMHIVVDGQGKVAGVADTLSAGHDAQGTNFVVLHLHKGDSVWVTTFAYADVKIYGSFGFTSFSGVLLYEY